MSFGGAVSAMIASLKNNKRKKVSAFEKLERFQKENSDKLYFEKSASKKELDLIKNRIQKENRTRTIKNGIVALTIFIILIVIVFVFINS